MPSAPPTKRSPCATHRLATGPDGLCTLCRRALAPRSAEKLPIAVADDDPGTNVVTRLLGIGLMLSIAAFAAYAFNTWSAGMTGPGAALGPEPQPRGMPRRTEPKPKALQPTAGGAPGTPDQQAVEQSAAAQTTVLTAEDIERERQRDLEVAEQDRRRSEQIKADMDARSRKRARANVSITMYSTTWCPSCTRAREYMTREGILFVEHDIEQSDSARTIMERLNPRGSIPTIDIDGAILVGFSGSKIEDTIDAAVKKRSGG